LDEPRELAEVELAASWLRAGGLGVLRPDGAWTAGLSLGEPDLERFRAEASKCLLSPPPLPPPRDAMANNQFATD
jgi:hypothetical protein